MEEQELAVEALDDIVLVEDINKRALVTVSDVQSWLTLVTPKAETSKHPEPKPREMMKGTTVHKQVAPLFEDDDSDDGEQQYTQVEKGKGQAESSMLQDGLLHKQKQVWNDGGEEMGTYMQKKPRVGSGSVATTYKIDISHF